MFMKLGDAYRVKLRLHFKCKQCGKEYYREEESMQPSTENIDKFIVYFIEKINTHPYEYFHLCGSLPEPRRENARIWELHNGSNTIYANFGVGELIGFEVDSTKYDTLEDAGGEG